EQGPARAHPRNARRAGPAPYRRQRAHDEDQSVGGRDVPRGAKAPRYCQNARKGDEKPFEQLNAGESACTSCAAAFASTFPEIADPLLTRLRSPLTLPIPEVLHSGS